MHARANAFPLGLAVLTGRGVTAWRAVLTEFTANTSTPPAAAMTPRASSTLPARVAADLINALAAIALAGT